jgi:hypothetical protein
MNIQNLKQRILDGQISDEELSKLLVSHPGGTAGFMQNILKGFVDGYTKPNLWRSVMESILIFSVILGVITLAYAGKMDAMMAAVMLSLILGFLLGKIK